LYETARHSPDLNGDSQFNGSRGAETRAGLKGKARPYNGAEISQIRDENGGYHNDKLARGGPQFAARRC
jgi:hypothetical protein